MMIFKYYKKIKMKEINNEIRKNNCYKDLFSYNIKNYRILNNLFFILILVIDLFKQISAKNSYFSINSSDSYITLKIKGIGDKQIYNPNKKQYSRSYHPHEIYINGEEQNIIDSHYYFNQTENNVKLKWNYPIKNCAYMFGNCDDIIEADISNFNLSQVTRAEFMFSNCTSLTSINLTNINTSSITRMNRMFENCLSMTSIDLSYFNTSELEWVVLL